MIKTINIMDLHNSSIFGCDFTPAVLEAVNESKHYERTIIKFPKGTYHFWPDRAYEKYCYISNNDSGIKRIVFSLLGLNQVTIDGGESEFVFHGRILPFAVDNSCTVELKNFSVDYERPFFTQGNIIDSGNDYVDICIDKEEYPYRLEDDRIIFYSENWESEQDDVLRITEVDAESKMTVNCPSTYVATFRDLPGYVSSIPQRMFHRKYGIKYREIGFSGMSEGIVRMHGSFEVPHKIGNIIAIRQERRYNPAVFITRSENVCINNVNIYHAASMGIVAQVSRDIALKNSNIKVRPGSERVISSNQDATHFVNCMGTITMENCIFENMFDDGTNVHGMYTVISNILDKRNIEVKLMHFEQEGVNIYSQGDILEFAEKDTLRNYFSCSVDEVYPINSKFIRIKLKQEIPDITRVGDVIDNAAKAPELIIKNCKVGLGRGSGFRVNTSKAALIEGNKFYTCGAGLMFAGDANSWYESTGVRNVKVEKNVFRCDSSAIVINPKITGKDAIGSYHRNIIIRENLFHEGQEYHIKASHAQELDISDNYILNEKGKTELSEDHILRRSS